jgi:hypothetical protein
MGMTNLRIARVGNVSRPAPSMSLPGLTGQSSTYGQLPDRPVKPGDDSEMGHGERKPHRDAIQRDRVMLFE